MENKTEHTQQKKKARFDFWETAFLVTFALSAGHLREAIFGNDLQLSYSILFYVAGAAVGVGIARLLRNRSNLMTATVWVLSMAALFAPQFYLNSFKIYSPSDLSYSVMFPRNYQESTVENDGVPLSIVSADYDSMGFAASSLTVPVPPASDEELKALFEQLIHGASQGMPIINDEEISINGLAGREIQVQASGSFIVTSRLFIFGDRAYNLTVAAPESYETVRINEFLDSFQVLKN